MDKQLRVRMKGSLALAAALAMVASLLLSALPAAAQSDPCVGATPATTFADYAQARDAHQASIDCGFYRAIWPGAATGANGESLFRPLDAVTREETAQFIVDALLAAGYDDVLPAATATDQFDDISSSAGRVAINRLALAGVIRGVSADTFDTDGELTRQQLASFLVQSANFAADSDIAGDGRDRFSDVQSNNVHKRNIEDGADADLFRGTSATTFRPGRTEMRDAMASFAINLFRHAFDSARAPAPFSATTTLNDVSLEAGDILSGTVKGSNLSSVTVDGCGLADQTLSDANALLTGIQFSVRLPSTLSLGACSLDFAFEFANGTGRQATEGLTIQTPSSGGGGGGTSTRGRTPQPELTSAKITEVDTTGGGIGTTVRYTFDENIETAASPARFYILDRDGNRHIGDSFVGATATDKNSTVDVLFDGGAGGAPDTEAEADLLTVATVDFAAVQDVANDDSPEGDAALGTLTNSTTSLKAGTTLAPDLLRADVRADIHGTDEVYEVDFIFDELVATATTVAGDFRLVLEDGTTILDCTATDPTPASTNVDTECGTLGGPDWQPGDASRAIVDAGVVADAAPHLNVFQAGEAEGDDGNTDLPDLVSANFHPGATDTDPDKVGFRFDEDISDLAVICNQLSVYSSTMGSDTANSCVWDSARIVVAEFDPDELQTAVGAAVLANTVFEDSVAFRGNFLDEVGVANSSANTGAGFTTGPDLTGVHVERDRSVLGTVKGIIATYTFDEDVDALVAASDFYLYDSSGERYQAVTCVPTDLGDEPTVECTAFEKWSTGTLLNLNGEVDLYNAAALGTVDDGAILDLAPLPNPEGASRVTAS